VTTNMATMATTMIPVLATTSLSQSGKSQPRSGNLSTSRRSTSYQDKDRARERKAFNDMVWEFAKPSFVLKIWTGGAFFALYSDSADNAPPKVLTVYAREAYNTAVAKYIQLHPDQESLVNKAQLRVQQKAPLASCLLKVFFSSYNSFLTEDYF